MVALHVVFPRLPNVEMDLLLKVYQRLQYFPKLQTIPGAVISHIRSGMDYLPDLVPDIASATLYRHYAAIRTHLEIKSQGKEIRHIAARAMHQAAQVMESPADLINAATQTLLIERTIHLLIVSVPH